MCAQVILSGFYRLSHQRKNGNAGMVAMMNALLNAIWSVSVPFSIQLYFPFRRYIAKLEKDWLVINIQWLQCHDVPVKNRPMNTQ